MNAVHRVAAAEATLSRLEAMHPDEHETRYLADMRLLFPGMSNDYLADVLEALRVVRGTQFPPALCVMLLEIRREVRALAELVAGGGVAHREVKPENPGLDEAPGDAKPRKKRSFSPEGLAAMRESAARARAAKNKPKPESPQDARTEAAGGAA